MVECAAEKELPREIEVEPISVITGDNNYKKFLYYQLKMSIRQADAIDIVVSFLMESGVRMLLKDLQAATGVGKTYLAAFDSVNFKRVLFVAELKDIIEYRTMEYYRSRYESKE